MIESRYLVVLSFFILRVELIPDRLCGLTIQFINRLAINT